LDCLRLSRFPDFFYYFFRNHEQVRWQFSQQVEPANVREVDEDVRVGYNDTDSRKRLE
jgi:hypothetical protein